MKKNLAHLPKCKQDELKLIVEKIREHVEPEKIILFGSYARGDWVGDIHAEGWYFFTDRGLSLPSRCALPGTQ